MNPHIWPIGAPNSFVRFVQENPSEMTGLIRACLSMMPEISARELHAHLEKTYQIRMHTSLTLPFNATGETDV